MVRLSKLLQWLVLPPALAFGSTSAPPAPPSAPPPPPAAPMFNSPQGAAAAEEAKRRAMAARGFGSTIITGPMGDTSTPMTTDTSLLGS